MVAVARPERLSGSEDRVLLHGSLVDQVFTKYAERRLVTGHSGLHEPHLLLRG